jgi:uncharacterized membrane protein YgcG
MNMNRLIKHLWSHSRKVEKCFSKEDLAAITNAIRDSEAQHSGQICFAVEGALDTLALLKDLSPRDRAIEVFTNLRVWDTEHNNGVLIYILLADHAVEIIADRGIHSNADASAWDVICHEIESKFALNEYQAGILSGIEMVSQLLQSQFPGKSSSNNEIPDTPVLMN